MAREGTARFRGFYGDYQLTVRGREHPFTLRKDGENRFAIRVCVKKETENGFCVKRQPLLQPG